MSMKALDNVNSFQLNRHHYFPGIFVVGTLMAVAVLVLLGFCKILTTEDAIKSAFPAVAGVAAFVYFLYTQHLQETRLFVDLFKQFNERYDKLNEKLNQIVSQQQSTMNLEQIQALNDYFNLCAEEWLYFKAGYIDPAVWASWREGMKFFLGSPDIRNKWTEELRQGSYYGLTLAEIEGSKL